MGRYILYSTTGRKIHGGEADNLSRLLRDYFAGARSDSALKSWSPPRIEPFDISGTILTAVDFGYLHISGSNFRGIRLSRGAFVKTIAADCDFTGADLRDASFDNAILRHARFPKTLLHKASFINCDLSFVDFSGADLAHADFEGCNLTNTNFTGACLRGCRGLPYGLL